MFETEYPKLLGGVSPPHPGPWRRGVEGVKGQGSVNILCHNILFLLYISPVHFYDNLSALKG